MPAMPAMPGPPRAPTPFPRAATPFPPRPGVGTAPRPTSDRPPGTGTDRPPGAPHTARFPSAVPVAPDDAGAFEGEDDAEEATKVHAPAPEVLRTLALHDAANARAAAQARISAHQAEHARHAGQGAAPDTSAAAAEAASLEAAARDGAMNPGRVTPVPPSLGGTLMMSPAAQFPSKPSGMNAPAAPAPSPYGAPPKGNLHATMAMGMPQTPGHGFTPPAPPPGHGSQVVSQPPQQQGIQGMAAPYGQGSAIIPATHPPPFGGAGLATYGRPSTDQPFAAPSFAQPPSQPQLPQSQPQPQLPDPAAAAAPRPLPIVPIAIGLAALALGGIGLGFFALRARHQTPVDPSAMSSSDVPSASVALTPVPVDPPLEPTAAAAPETDAAPAVAEVEDAATTAVVEDSAAPAPSASASASAALTTATTASAPVYTWPPPTASAAPSAKAVDPNAFDSSAARSRLATANGVLSFCKKEGGVTGPGNASITFGNDGSVSGVAIDAPYAGTKEGDCVSAQFRRAKVTPFTGPPQTVRHGFEIPK